MRRITIALFVSMLTLVFAASALAQTQGTKQSYGYENFNGYYSQPGYYGYYDSNDHYNYYTPARISSFSFLVDHSSSMEWIYRGTRSPKLFLAQELLQKINQRVPGTQYQAGLQIFSGSKAIKEFGPYNREEMDYAIKSVVSQQKPGFPNWRLAVNTPYGARATKWSLGEGLKDFAAGYSNQPRQGAVIVVTDGAYGRGADSVNEAMSFYQQQPGMCLHFISFANEMDSQRSIEKMAALNPCSVLVNAEDLLVNDSAIDYFVQRVFNLDSPYVIPNFVTGRSEIRPEHREILDRVVEHLKANPTSRVEVGGFTDITGNPTYNLGLGMRRADSAKAYIVRKGIEKNRVYARSYGTAYPRFDNMTEEGKAQNRRVEFKFFTFE